MAENQDPNFGRCMSPEVRFVHPHLFTPHAPNFQGQQREPKYETILLADPKALNELKATAKKIAQAKWPGRDFKNSPVLFPFKSGDKLLAKREENRAAGRKGPSGKALGALPKEYAGMTVIRATSTRQPEIIDLDNKTILDPKRFYSGVYGVAELTLKAWDGNGANIPDSVAVYINCVMKTRDGDRIGGVDVRKVFEGVRSRIVGEDPTQGMEDDGAEDFDI